MKPRFRTVAAGGLFALLALGFAGAWLLGRVLPRYIQPRGALAQAAIEPGTDSLRRSLAGRARFAPEDEAGREAVIWAARTGRPESIALLTASGAPASFRDDGPNGWQPLHHAVHKNQAASVRALLAAGAEVDGANPEGMTPLMLAAAQGEGEIVEILLRAGADPARRGPGGQNALTFALSGGDVRVVRALRERAPGLSPGTGLRVRVGRFLLFARGRSEALQLLDRVEPTRRVG